MDIRVHVEAPDVVSAITALTEALQTNGIIPQPAKPPAPETPSVDLSTVRAKLASLSQGGKQAPVRELIASYGAAKLTDIPPEHYAELLAKAEAL